MKIIGIPRAPENSPNMSEKDSLLFNAIVEKLQAKGHAVKIITKLDEENEKYDMIFHMSRTMHTLQQIAKYEKSGTTVINSVNSVQNCSRDKVVYILEKEGIRQPAYRFIETPEETTTLSYPGWLKKAEGWSCHADDVIYTANANEATEALLQMKSRGVNKALYCKHIEGDIIKFYGVAGNNFFRWHYPDPDKTKFGLERMNGAIQKHCFSEETLKNTAFAAAQAIGVEIFGGDCIVTTTGEIYIIDLNDFPSFSADREEAAESITALIEKR
ncbi:MAG: hypothetical protein IJY75_02575 [Bacteroidaceae bacterium]|nr:hypothetical protein [Bacteroidaceae bacterium]